MLGDIGKEYEKLLDKSVSLMWQMIITIIIMFPLALWKLIEILNWFVETLKS